MKVDAVTFTNRVNRSRPARTKGLPIIEWKQEGSKAVRARAHSKLDQEATAAAHSRVLIRDPVHSKVRSRAGHLEAPHSNRKKITRVRESPPDWDDSAKKAAAKRRGLFA